MFDIERELSRINQIELNSIDSDVDIIPDVVKSSIILYNKALANIKSKSEDIAVIELKKAISLRTDFHEAYYLLGICYLYRKDFEKALDAFENAAAGGKDINAKRLIDEINENYIKNDSRAKAKQSQVGVSSEKSKNIKENEKYSKNKFKISLNPAYVKYISLAIAFVLILVLVIVVSGKSQKAKYTMSLQEEHTKIEALKNSLAESNDKYKKLENEHQTIKAKNELLEKENDYFKSIGKLSEIEGLEALGRFQEAADKLVLLKDFKFKNADKTRYTNIYNRVVPKAALAAYNEGYSLSYSNKYNEAIEKLNKVRMYGNSWAFMESTLYRLGISYKNTNNNKKAIEVFNIIIKNYPNSSFSSYAKARIAEIS